VRQITQMEDKNAAHRAMALYLYIVGLSMNAIARMIGVAPSSVLYWIRNFALRVYEKPTPQGAVVIELDERWHFLGSKKTKIWVWKAYCRTTGQLVDWECGDRSSKSLGKMLDRLTRLSVRIFFADRWQAYAELISPELLIQTKAETHGIERNNFRRRHWCGRFRRKTCMVSRSLLMIDLSVFLFARFHVNGAREEIWNFVHNPY
jgi:IS1 family transposase